jgi:hypothetical protein
VAQTENYIEQNLKKKNFGFFINVKLLYSYYQTTFFTLLSQKIQKKFKKNKIKITIISHIYSHQPILITTKKHTKKNLPNTLIILVTKTRSYHS